MATIRDITERLCELPPEKLVVVYDFVSYLAASQQREHCRDGTPASFLWSFGRDWNSPDEDAAWADL